MWDDLDLARAAAAAVAELPADRKLQVVVVDEVQDLTIFHHMVILGLAADPNFLFMAGDIQQAIHPSGFDWERLRMRVYQHVQEVRKRQSQCKDPEIKGITTNYRSPEAVVELANAITVWREKTYGETHGQLEAVLTGDPIAQFAPFNPLVMSEHRTYSAGLIVLVADEEHKEKARELFPIAHVFTIHESKGLERDDVFLWGIFSSAKEKWRALERGESSPYEDRYLVNLLTVAVTRARRHLFIIDDWLPSGWGPLGTADFALGDTAERLIIEALSRKGGAQEYLIAARELESNGNFEQAADFFRLAGRSKDAARCRAKHARDRDQLLEAGLSFREAGMRRDAIECFEACGEFQEAAATYLQAEMDEVSAMGKLFDAYLDDPRKMGKLSGLAESIGRALEAGHPGVSEMTLIRYARERTGDQSHKLRTVVGDLKKVGVRDYRNALGALTRVLAEGVGT